MHFEVRFADTGFPRRLDNIISIQMLQEQIFKQYKIQKCNQKFVSKKGVIITSQDRIDSQNLMKKTFSGDANNPKIMSQTLGIYLFNHKQLLKNHVDQTVELGSQNVLQKMRQTSQQLRTNIYELEPFEKKFTLQEIIRINAINPNLQQIANYWHQMSVQVVDVGLTYKQNQSCFDQYIQRWENQRKALIVLTRNLQILTAQKRNSIVKLNEFLKNTKAKFYQQHKVQQIQKQMQSSLNRDQNKNNISAYKNKVISISQQIKHLSSKLKSLQSHQISIQNKTLNFKKKVKTCHIELQKQVKAMDQFKRRKSNQLQQRSSTVKSNYSQLIQGIKQKLQKNSDSKLICHLNDRKNIQQKFRKYQQSGLKYNQQLQIKFGQLFRLYTEHISMVRSDYRIYNDLYIECQETLKQCYIKLQNQISGLYHCIGELSQFRNQQDRVNLKIMQRDTSLIPQHQQTQYKRRSLFNTKLQCLQQQIKQILKQQQSSRRKYLQNMFLITETYNNQILSNTQVPCLLFNFDQCSDRQLLVKIKSSSRGRDREMKENGFSQIDVEMYRECLGMDRILRQLEIVKNCQISLKSDPNPTLQPKLKNLQTILQKSSDIFHRIYSHKLSLLTKQHTQTLQSHITRITTLQTQNKELHNRIYTYTQNISSDIQNKKELGVQVEKLKNQLQEAICYRVEVEEGYERTVGDLEKRINMYQLTIQSNKKQMSSLKQQKRNLEENLNHLISSTQKLFSEIQQLREVNHEYKVVMGDQGIKIATLETQLQILREQSNIENNNPNQSKLKQSFYGNNLNLYLNKPQNKNLIQQPLIPPTQNNIHQQQQIEQTVKFPTVQLKQLQKQIGKLQKQIQQLKEENQQLKNLNEDLNKQILEIAMKDTEDIQVQTEQVGLVLERQSSLISNMESNSSALVSQHIKIDSCPQVGQLRIFLPFTNDLYISLKTPKHPQSSPPPPYSPLNYLTSQTRNYLNIHQTELISQQQQSYPYILDMNCLTSKARELLTQCTLVVVLRVSKILPGSERYYVQGEIVAAMGFEDQDLGVKDYASFFR